VRRDRFGPSHSGKFTNGTPGLGLEGCISEAWPLADPALAVGSTNAIGEYQL
jgi:hypothetical protein